MPRIPVRVEAPLAGAAVSLAEVPDPVFAALMVGPGIAVEPTATATTVFSPLDGVLVKLVSHAFVVVGEGGRGVLVHLGIDTVGLDDAGFELVAEAGQSVRTGDPVTRWDPHGIAMRGLRAICPIIALDAKPESLGEYAFGPVRVGDQLFTWS